MKKLSAVLSLILGLVLALPAFGQTILSTTTLSAAVTDSATTVIPLTSTTGIVAAQTVIFVADTAGSGEAMFVNTVGTGYVAVTRGYQNLGGASKHASGTLVFYGPANAFGTVQPNGSCTRANATYLPVISLGLAGTSTAITDCIGGVWVTGSGIGSASPFFRVVIQNCGGTLLSTPCGTNTTLTANDLYCSELDVPFSKYVTGLGVLNGATASTDKHLVVLYDGTGNLVANSATGGVTASGTNVYQTIAFTTPYYVVGPAKYYGCLQTNGTTATLNMSTTGILDQMTTKSYTGTFGTIPATITVPTTYTTAVGPLFELY